MDIFVQGEDIYREVSLTDADGNAIDTSIFLTITAKVRGKYNIDLLDTLTLAAGEITKETPTTDGIISMIIPGSVTADAGYGDYKCEIVTTETDSDYPSNTRIRKHIIDNFFRLYKDL